MSFLAVVFLALAVSIDGLGVGFACGMGRVRISFLSLILMGTAAGLAVLVSMLAGSLAGVFLNSFYAEALGGLLLIGFGLLMLVQSRKADNRGGLLGLLDNPSRADIDHSGTISAREAVVLGIALALDGFGAGFGAALAGFPPLVTGAAVALTKVILVSGGVELGHLASGSKWVRKLKVIPGVIICALGILKFFLF